MELTKNKITNVCVVIPTYNEAENIIPTLERLYSPKNTLSPKVTINTLVVDDSSPDGTADIVRNYMKTNSNVHLLVRTKKEGLGAAYIAGMQHAMKLLSPDALIEMDADGSHEPSVVYEMVKQLRKGYTFVIGSRYIQGGSSAEDWAWYRSVFSNCANFTTKLLLNIKNVKDMSGGFRAIHNSILKKVDFKSLNVKGFGFQAVLLEEAIHQGAFVKEIPIQFKDREEGNSKMTIKDMIEPFYIFTKIRFHRLTSGGAK